MEFFYSKDEKLRRKMKEEKKWKERNVSTVVTHKYTSCLSLVKVKMWLN